MHGAQRLTLGVFLYCSPPGLLRWRFSLAWEFADSAVLVDPPVPTSPALAYPATRDFLHGF